MSAACRSSVRTASWPQGWENNLSGATKVYNLEFGTTYGMVFRIENDGDFLLDQP